MLIFLKFVGAMIVALILVVIGIYLYIKWKFRKLFKNIMEAIGELGAPTVPPFRIKLRPKSDVFDEDDDDFDSPNQVQFDALSQELTSLGFEKIDDYFVEEIGMSMTAFANRETSTYGMVFDHPVAKVWCEVVRRYKDESSWTYSTNADHLMDRPTGSTQHYFPGESSSTIIENFQDEAPNDNAVLFDNKDFPKYFEKVYAKEMDWRIERGGVTEAEIRRVAERDNVECTREQIDGVQQQWRVAISEFFSERVLKRYRKDSQLPRLEWEVLEDQAVVIHERMQAEEIYLAFDDEYYPETTGVSADEDEYDRKERDKWNGKLEQVRENLKQSPPQQAFRSLVESVTHSDSNDGKWEFHTSVEKPIPADIWMHIYDDEDDNYVDDEDEDNDWDDE